MTAATAILICSFGAVLGWVAARFEQTAQAERWAEKRPHGPPRSHCRLVRPTALYDQDRPDPTGDAYPGGGGVPGRTRAPTATSGAASGPGGAITSASRAAPNPPAQSDR